MPKNFAAAEIRIVVVDDHAMFAESVARLLDRERRFSVVGVAATSSAAIELVRATQPDVAIVDFGLPDADGTNTAREIREVSPSTKVLLLTGLPDDGVATLAVQAGCSGFLTKDKASQELVTAVHVVNSGKAFIPQAHLADLHRGLATERIRSEFISRVGHEFRTPLTAILGYGVLLANRTLPDDVAREVGEQIVQSSKQLRRIVEILEFTASSACGAFELQPRPTYANEVIDAATDRWSDRLGDAHEFAIEGSARNLRTIAADPYWLPMAIDELIDNAVKFSPDGGVVILSASPTSVASGAAVEISVSDQGIGMSASAREVAFEEYMQIDSSDTRRFGGLGLGLSVVRGIAVAHNGVASCAPAAPVGTRFSISIPTVANGRA